MAKKIQTKLSSSNKTLMLVQRRFGCKGPDGKVVFIPNVVPGDVVDVQTFKKRKAYYEGKS
jgi:tRNA/tmRNA/rRNA uracil-C5-methylase (TrmA/RlmC/RlmD family)